jgi:hypothetical protein
VIAEAFTALAKMMGANKNSAGTLGSFSRNMSSKLTPDFVRITLESAIY